MYKISDTANKTDTTNKLIMYNTKKTMYKISDTANKTINNAL